MYLPANTMVVVFRPAFGITTEERPLAFIIRSRCCIKNF
jgi:hypothetical protein